MKAEYSTRRVQEPKEGWNGTQRKLTIIAQIFASMNGSFLKQFRLTKLNASGRRPGGSELIALDIDEPGVDGLYNLRAIKPLGYTGATGDETLDLLGFDAEILDGDTINFYLINHRPPIGPFNNILDASVLGTNSTIDVFEMRRGEENMRHLRTVWSSEVFTPNRVAVLGGGHFLVTNDHSGKLGWVCHLKQSFKPNTNAIQRRELDPIIGGGNVAYCPLNGNCHIAVEGNEEEDSLPAPANEPIYKTYLNRALKSLPKAKLKFPNGLTRGFDGLIYVPSSVDGQVRVYAPTTDNLLKQIDTIHVGMPLDNISPDATGDLYVPGFPSYFQAYKGLEDPYSHISPASIFRIRKTVDAGPEGVRSVDYRVEKVLEDRDGEVINGATTVRHDAKTGRLFIGCK